MTKKIKSTRFGELEIEKNKLIEIPEGMLGFDERRFVILSPGNGPFHWLQSVDDPDLAFVVVDPRTSLHDYEVKLTVDEQKKLGLSKESEIVVLSVVTMAKNPLDITINLMGPIILNPGNMTAIQVVLESGKYSTRHPYFSGGPEGKEEIPAVLKTA
jgi:flagellar assembly factor FliW